MTCSSFSVLVTVVDNGDGSLSATTTYPAEGGNALTNAYGTNDATVVISGRKELSYATGLTPDDIAGKFTFTLRDSGGAVVGTATNDATGAVEFEPITYTLDDLNEALGSTGEAAAGTARSHVFTYTVSESGAASGVTNDATEKTVKVRVTDDGSGRLTAEVVRDGADLAFTFTNTYGVTPVSSSITDQLSVTKTLSGRDMEAGEFEFGLFEGDATDPVATGTNEAAADGQSAKVSFSELTFTEPGEHDYQIREITGSGNGVTADAATFSAHASVKDNGDGTLSVAWTLVAAGSDAPLTEAGFANTYEAASTSIQFNAAKVLTGRDLAEGEFTFELRENGQVLQSVSNAADGSVSFDPITYDEAGEHDYEIVEVAGNAEGVTYDSTVFTYHVTVSDDGEGQLTAEWSEGDEGAPVFHNAYEQPDEPAPPTAEDADGSSGELPSTGDTAGTSLAAALALAGAALIVVARVAIRRHG